MADENIYYGLLKYSSCNIGDEIQSIAASRFLPRIDKYVHRERINEYTADKPTKLIMNGWWMWHPEAFLATSQHRTKQNRKKSGQCHIDPLMISMHFTADARRYFKKNKDVMCYLREHGPVGCRDKMTYEYLRENNVDAYFSGCVTLTLQKNPRIKRKDFILAVDLPQPVVAAIRRRTGRPVYEVSRLMLPNAREDRFNTARAMLYLYHSAHCVVSSRLHTCMPCLALETPVLMVDTNDNLLRDDGRYDGLRELCNLVTENEFVENADAYDFENPPANPTQYQSLRRALIKKCSEFTGFNNTKSLIDDDCDNIILNLVMAMRHDRIMKCIQWWVSPKVLIRTWFKKVVQKRDMHNLKR